MKEIPKGSKLYKIDSKYKLITYIYIKKMDGKHVLEDERGVFQHVHTSFLNTLNFSSRVVMTEAEEELRKILSNVHDQMREIGLRFNPHIDTVDVKYITTSGYMKEVHQYSLDGDYIGSFQSSQDAQRAIKGEKTKRSGMVSAACTGVIKTAYGFRWSHKKVKKLAP